MSIRVHVGGQILPQETARVSVFDRGFLYGDSVYETLASNGGRLFALSEHLDRLARSALLVGIVLPARAEIEAAVHATVAAAGNAESRVRIIISRGEGIWGELHGARAASISSGSDVSNVDGEADRSMANGNLVVIAGPRGGPTAEMYDQGVAVAVVNVVRQDPRTLDPSVKSGNYLPAILALGEARRRGSHEAILCTAEGVVAEGASSNVFLVKDGRVFTPALSVGILPGITRAHVLALCRQAGLEAREAEGLLPGELRAADEVFITSSVRGVLPVTRVDDHVLGTGRPGPVSRQLMRLYERHTSEDTP